MPAPKRAKPTAADPFAKISFGATAKKTAALKRAVKGKKKKK